jgi:adenosylcobinamide hydrolase
MKRMYGRVHTRYQVIDHTLVINLGGRRRVLASAPQGGGFGHACYIMNHQVEPDAHSDQGFPDPARYLRRLASRLGIRGGTVGLMTAVPMTQVVMARVSTDRLWVECFATIGVTNAVRVGAWPVSPLRQKNGETKPGTINLILITNAHLSGAAMVTAVQVVTEAKTGVLLGHPVLKSSGNPRATGTGTDAVVIACRLRGQGAPLIYSGTHTVIGALIGRAVTRCVSRGLVKFKKWQERLR